jgi:hypothetical protein
MARFPARWDDRLAAIKDLAESSNRERARSRGQTHTKEIEMLLQTRTL